MKNYSTTQATNVTAIVGIVMFVLPYFGVEISSEEVTQFVGAVFVIVGTISNFVHRYKKNDVNLAGFRK